MEDKYTFDHETLPAIRRLIVDINRPYPDGSHDPTQAHDVRTAAAIQGALLALLALVHDLADAHYAQARP